MRAVPVLTLILIGAFFLIARNFYARFVTSLVYQIPAVKDHEETILKSAAVISACFGVAFILLGILMAFNVVFPW